MEKKLLAIANGLLAQRMGTSILLFLSLAMSIFGIVWTVFSAAGVQGSPVTLALVVVVSLLIASSFLLLRFCRWNLIHWALRKKIDQIVSFDPSVVIGLGYGGGLLAALISKLLADRTKKEPHYCVIDRTFVQEGKSTVVEVGGVGEVTAENFPQHANVLLVTAEVNSGSTIRKASQYLNSRGITHKTFTFLLSPVSREEIDYFILQSDSRAILPWQQERRHRGQRPIIKHKGAS